MRGVHVDVIGERIDDVLKDATRDASTVDKR